MRCDYNVVRLSSCGSCIRPTLLVSLCQSKNCNCRWDFDGEVSFGMDGGENVDDISFEVNGVGFDGVISFGVNGLDFKFDKSFGVDGLTFVGDMFSRS